MGAVVQDSQLVSGSGADDWRQSKRMLAHRYSAEYCSLHLKQQQQHWRGQLRQTEEEEEEEDGRGGEGVTVQGGERGLDKPAVEEVYSGKKKILFL